MISLILAATFAAVCLLTYGIFAYRNNRRQIQDRFKKPKTDPLPVLRRMDKQNKVKTRFIEWTSIFGKFAIKDKEDQPELSDLRTTLIQAGFRHPGAPAAFFGIRVILAILLPAISMAVLLLKGQPNTINLLSAACLVSGDTCEHAKPHPMPLLHAAALMSVAPEKCLYLGDDLRDMEAARAANMAGIIASYGYIDPAADTRTWPSAGSVQTPFALLRYIHS